MRLPDSALLHDFWAALAAAPTAALLLDYDGTLAPFHIDPAEARPYPGVEPLLDRIGHHPRRIRPSERARAAEAKAQQEAATSREVAA